MLQGSLVLSVTSLVACSARAPIDPPDVRIVQIESLGTGHHVAVGCADGTVRVVDAGSGDVVRTYRCDERPASALVASPDGGRLAVGTCIESQDTDGASRTSPVWRWLVIDLSVSGPGVRTWIGDGRGWDSSVCFSQDGRRVLQWSDELPAAVFDAVTGRKLFELADPTERITCGRWDETHGLILTGGGDGAIRSWSSSTGMALDPVRWISSRAPLLAVSPDGGRVFVGADEKTGRVLSLPRFELEQPDFRSRELVFDEDVITSAHWSADGERIVFTTGPWYTIECHSRTGELLWMHDFRGGDDSPLLCVLDPSSEFACTWSWPGYGCVFDVHSGTCLLDLRRVSTHSDQLEWTGDGAFLLALGADGLDVVPRASVISASTAPLSVLRLRATATGFRTATLSFDPTQGR